MINAARRRAEHVGARCAAGGGGGGGGRGCCAARCGGVRGRDTAHSVAALDDSTHLQPRMGRGHGRRRRRRVDWLAPMYSGVRRRCWGWLPCWLLRHPLVALLRYHLTDSCFSRCNDAPCPPFISHGASIIWWHCPGSTAPRARRLVAATGAGGDHAIAKVPTRMEISAGSWL
jgi:hypothetical protein